jgi:splicing factor U2AF subunit
LKIGRPKGYVPQTHLLSGPAAISTNPLMSSLQPAGSVEPLSHVIMASNLPALCSEEQVRELFTPFGELKAFNLIKTAGGATQSAAFEFLNPELTDGVVAGMDKLDIAGQKLSVQRVPMSSASILLKPASTASNGSMSAQVSPRGEADPLALLPPCNVIRLSNMTTPEDLTDERLYEELIEDVADECNTHATVKSVVVPRAAGDPAAGRIFVHFTDSEGAEKARRAVAGRKFNGKIVEAVFYPEELFLRKIYNLPPNYSGSADLD